MKLSVFCGVSVDGFLARPDHSLDFLETGEQEPHGFEEFYRSVDVVVIGRKTFEVVLTFGKWYYGTKPVVVLSSLSEKNRKKLLEEGAEEYLEKNSLMPSRGINLLPNKLENVICRINRRRGIAFSSVPLHD